VIDACAIIEVMSELGKIEKPSVESFAGKKKLLVVPLLFCSKEAPLDYVIKYNVYWDQVGEQIAQLEARIGNVAHIYHETISVAGESGLKTIERINEACYHLVKEKTSTGAALEATEERELTEESIDWERCLFIGLISRKAIEMISKLYIETMRKRYESIAKRIADTLKPDETGVLFITENHMIQFPADIEVFSVSPPMLDQIKRWQRERQEQAEKSAAAEQEAEAQPPAEKKPD
jgi:hypothetical protein